MKIRRVIENPVYNFPCVIVTPGGKSIQYENIPLINIIVDQLPDELEAIICCSDLQACDSLDKPPETRQLKGLTVSEELKLLSDCELLPSSQNTGVILAGDFYCDSALEKRGGSGDVQEIWRSFGNNFKWVVGVAGNHDRFGGDHTIPNSMSHLMSPAVLDGEIIERNGLCIGGLSGISGRIGKPWRRPEHMFVQDINRLLKKHPDIFILHEGPSAPEISCRGNDNIRKTLDSSGHDLIVISGHYHWHYPVYQMNNNVQIINADFRIVALTEQEINRI